MVRGQTYKQTSFAHMSVPWEFVDEDRFGHHVEERSYKGKDNYKETKLTVVSMSEHLE